ncbi:carotenoid biosynthesis protein [Asanoa siamensis]|uniref:Membrane protein n=1 Tax=Asanoa siamensis TaxID=926357 RepID=A0ABQ4CZS7_9ACTN|nr:carotenoid biosynthesis protein [Asanoa siamensis]GIF76799.1 membrane protein [Asanoa siamensis]
MTNRLVWYGLGLLILAQICYPLTGGGARAAVTVTTVVLGFLLSVGHAALTRGVRTAGALVLVTTGGGLLVEGLGVATGWPFGDYTYSGALGPKIAGVPWVIPLAWTWMAWPAWLAAVRLVHRRAARIVVAGVGLAAWDVFLDPQMVAEGYWTWSDPSPSLPGVSSVPLGNYAGWLVVALLMMALLSTRRGTSKGPDAPMYALYLWTYFSSILAHAAFLGLPASAAWGALAMGLVALPLAASLVHVKTMPWVRA